MHRRSNDRLRASSRSPLSVMPCVSSQSTFNAGSLARWAMPRSVKGPSIPRRMCRSSRRFVKASSPASVIFALPYRSSDSRFVNSPTRRNPLSVNWSRARWRIRSDFIFAISAIPSSDNPMGVVSCSIWGNCARDANALGLTRMPARPSFLRPVSRAIGAIRSSSIVTGSIAKNCRP